jgi:hypothetical protein
MPAEHRAFWGWRYPDLDSPDHETKIKAWKAFARNPESKPYRVFKPKYY